MLITSKSNPIVKELASLKEKKGRRERGSFLVEGGKMVSECLKSDLFLERIVLREDMLSLFEWAKGLAEEVVLLSADAFSYVADEKTPQGILAEVQIPKYAWEPPQKSCILLDGVSDPANVGAIIRTAVAVGIEEILLADCADPYSPKSVRSSMSGVFFAKLLRGSRTQSLEALKGIPMIAADMRGENVFTFVPPEKFCIVIGNEGNGISEEVKRDAAFTVSIPMGPLTESLNAAVSAGIIMYALRQNQI